MQNQPEKHNFASSSLEKMGISKEQAASMCSSCDNQLGIFCIEVDKEGGVTRVQVDAGTVFMISQLASMFFDSVSQSYGSAHAGGVLAAFMADYTDFQSYEKGIEKCMPYENYVRIKDNLKKHAIQSMDKLENEQ